MSLLRAMLLSIYKLISIEKRNIKIFINFTYNKFSPFKDYLKHFF